VESWFASHRIHAHVDGMERPGSLVYHLKPVRVRSDLHMGVLHVRCAQHEFDPKVGSLIETDEPAKLNFKRRSPFLHVEFRYGLNPAPIDLHGYILRNHISDPTTGTMPKQTRHVNFC
jgi:hypothetical protein